MADDFGALGSALYARLGTAQYTYYTNGTATTTGSVPVYDTLAPQGGSVAYPHIIYQFMVSVDEYKFAGGHGDSVDVMVKVVSNRQYPSMQAQPIYAQAHAAIQHAQLTITGSNLLRIERSSRIKYRDSDQYWHVGGLYTVDTWD